MQEIKQLLSIKIMINSIVQFKPSFSRHQQKGQKQQINSF